MARLDISSTDADPIRQFLKWFQAEKKAGHTEPEAMCVASATADGKPSARMVLLRGVDERGFVFYTNYTSRKGQELNANKHAAILFWWNERRRQVRITGPVRKVAAEESDIYFAQRPEAHRVSACASPQSKVIASRGELEKWTHQIEKLHPTGGPPRPKHWGGYRVEPREMEFWEQGADRLHDRIRYRKKNGVWIRERLAP